MPAVTITGTDPGSFVDVVIAPGPGMPVRAEDVQIVAQACANKDSWLNDDKASQTLGATFTGPGLNFDTPVALKTGRVLTVENLSEIDAEIGAIIRMKSGSILLEASGSLRSGLGRKRRRPRVILSDADHAINTTQGDCFVLSGTAAAPRIIKLNTVSSPVPYANEEIELIVPFFNAPAAGPGAVYSIQREDGTVICEFWDNGGNASVTARFEFDTVWHLGMNCSFVQTTFVVPLRFYGVIPGPGA